MTKVKKASRIIKKEYSTIRSTLYTNDEMSNPATVNVYNRNADSGYISNLNIIEIHLPDQNLEELLDDESDRDAPLKDRFESWPTWLSDLIEEMVHEFEYKIVDNKLSEDGKTLTAQYSRYLDANHDESFFTAICEVARRLSIKPEYLLFQLGRMK